MIEITAEIRALIDKAAAGVELAEDEYIDLSDGLIHCKKCGGQRQTVVPCFGKSGYFMPRCICQCQREAEEQRKAAEERQRRMERIKRRKAQGLQDRYLYDYTFSNDNGQNPLMDKAHAYVENWKEAYKSNIGLLLFGDVGTGKSFFAGCIANALLDRDVPVLMTNFPTILNRLTGMFSEDILICDPEAEYFPLVNRLEGQVIKISPTSTQYVNPMDINLNYSEDDNPLALKSDFILSFCELAAGGRNGLEPVEKTVIDRAVRIVYRPYIADPRPENMPLLEDLYDEIKRQPEPEAQRIAAALELYVHGSLNVFNHRTNVDINNRIVCFDIKELGKQLKSLGMLVIQDQVWNRVSQNRDQGKSTWYFVDEFHLLLRGEVGTWSVEIWKRFRKWDGIGI